MLRARVAAPAVGGAANQALVRLLADELQIGQRSVRLVAGAAGRSKVIAIDDVNRDEILARWPGLKV